MHLGALPGGAFGSSKPRFRVEVVLVRNRLVIPAVSGFPVVGLGVWVFNLLARAVDQKPSPCEVGGETERPVNALLKHPLDNEWALAVVQGASAALISFNCLETILMQLNIPS